MTRESSRPRPTGEDPCARARPRSTKPGREESAPPAFCLDIPCSCSSSRATRITRWNPRAGRRSIRCPGKATGKALSPPPPSNPGSCSHPRPSWWSYPRKIAVLRSGWLTEEGPPDPLRGRAAINVLPTTDQPVVLGQTRSAQPLSHDSSATSGSHGRSSSLGRIRTPAGRKPVPAVSQGICLIFSSKGIILAGRLQRQ